LVDPVCCFRSDTFPGASAASYTMHQHVNDWRNHRFLVALGMTGLGRDWLIRYVVSVPTRFREHRQQATDASTRERLAETTEMACGRAFARPHAQERMPGLGNEKASSSA